MEGKEPIKLRGHSLLALDSKGRLSIPTKHHDRLQTLCAGKLVATLDPSSGCVLIYPLPMWEDLEAMLEVIPNTNREVQKFLRIILGHAEDCHMDGSGRLLISASLRESAALGKQVVLAGVRQRFELWNEEAWRREKDSTIEQPPASWPKELEHVMY